MCGIFSISCGEPRLRWKKLLLSEIVARQGNLDDRITVTVHLIPAPLAALLPLLRPHIPRARGEFRGQGRVPGEFRGQRESSGDSI